MDLKKACEVMGITSNNMYLDDLKKKYRELSKKYHPDLYQDNPLSNLAEEKLKEINQAYEIIKEYINKNEFESFENYIIERDQIGRDIYLNMDGTLFNGKVKVKTKVGGYFTGEVKNGYLEGKVSIYNRDNFLSSESWYSNGIRNGEFLSYGIDLNLNSYIAISSNYKDGLLHGKYQAFTSNEKNQKVLEREQEFLYGKAIITKFYNVSGEIEVDEKLEIKDTPIEADLSNLGYDNGYAFGFVQLKHSEYIEKVEVDLGKLIGFSDLNYLKNNKIEKRFYRHGRLKKDFYKTPNQLVEIIKNPFERLNMLRYEKDGKVYSISVTEDEFNFYKLYTKLEKINRKFRVLAIMKLEVVSTVSEYLDEIYNSLLEWSDNYLIREKDFRNAQANQYNTDLLNELKPTSQEDYALKIRNRSILFGFYRVEDIYKELTEVKKYYSYDEINDIFDQITNQVIDLFVENFGFDEKTSDPQNLSIPRISDPEYLIMVFKEAHKKNYISNDLIEIVNILLRETPLTLSLLNIYVGIKYNMEYKKIVQNLQLESDYTAEDIELAEKILKEIYEFKVITKLKDFMFVMRLLLEKNVIESCIVKNNLKQTDSKYNYLNDILNEVKNEKNLLNIVYQKIDKLAIEKDVKKVEEYIQKIKKDLEREKQKEEEQRKNQIKETLILLRENLEVLDLNKIQKNDLDLDQEQFINLENISCKLDMRKGIEEFSDEIKNLPKIKEFLDIVNKKIKLYSEQLQDIKEKKNENSKKTEENKFLTTWLSFSIFGIIFVFYECGFFWGLLSIIWVPIVTAIISTFVVKDEKNKLDTDYESLKNKEIVIKEMITRLETLNRRLKV